ncbi:MAG: hypothetical protein MUF78_03565 [Candidatus Edwardsbacteria bacterium]|jgi:ligand-binding sensor domain-containing protein|nr:hypothetical protein [Candidatus Edwardsbacteria bacterium]
MHLSHLVLLAALGAGPQLSWQSHTDVNGIAALCGDSSGAVLGAATDGGLFTFSAGGGALLRRVTNIDGLPHIVTTAIAGAPDGRLWAGTAGGGLCAVDPATGAVVAVVDRDDGLISDTVSAVLCLRGPGGDRVIAGMAGGLSLVDPAGGAWLRNLYPSQGFPLQGAVKALAVRGDTLWVGTDQCLVFAPVAAMTSPAAWDTAAAVNVVSLTAADTMVIAGTASGAVRGNPGSAWTAFPGVTGPVRAAALLGDSVFFATATGVRRHWNGVSEWRNDGLPSTDVRGLVVDDQQRLWAGTAAGLARVEGASWSAYRMAGLGGNNCTAVAVGADGAAWAAHPPAGVSRLRGGCWQTFTQSTTGCPVDQVRSITCDERGDAWFCSGGNDAGSGVSRYTADSIWRNYAWPALPTNFVFAIVSASTDYLYFAHWAHPSLNDLVIRWDRRDSTWQTIWGPAYLMRPNCLAVGGDGSLWVGTHEMSYKGVHRRLPDGSWRNWTTSNSALPGDLVNAIAVDRSDRPWAGTGNGLARFDGTTFLPVTHDGMSAKITALAIDRAGNAWIGTDRGLHLRTWDGRWSSFTRGDLVDNGSRLLSDNVAGIAVAARDQSGDDIYIATDRGVNVISCRPGDATAPARTTIAPNPWVPGTGSPLMLGRLPDRAAVRVYTVDGRLVAAVPGPAAPAHQLYLRLGSGLPADLPSGIYLVHISGSDAAAEVLRLAVVR